ncbi:zinc ABC transporter substrate-binding protein [Tsukamurella sp. 8F]|uniref:metal ABC transporter solute-binding protein, Zn/Mn family n=1 Tax=unclassified Tsukamurella TaxID=2633480 RepID=UPI0023BA132A|nr:MULTISPECIES: zinc ABC transporter substrate-binding protein [unclassified Tsukamurella]MDF0532179.1 zinc ABC transporter substrate-binding protein [Tsukamurella sp. 8J]MDF0589258.1 zinc ABC transporter substrate-binding protein [Tsukamurella sp. 8F]
MRLRLLAATVTAVATVAACSSGGTSGGGDGKPQVVTSTDVYASIAKAVAGPDADVTALFTNPTGDPHEFEPSAQDTLKVKQASVVVENGGHYDAYMDSALDGTDVPRVDAYKLKFGTDDAKDAHGGEVNEHVFYDLATMKKVADALAKQLGEKDSAHSGAYSKRASQFDTQVDGVLQRAEGLKGRKARIASTEPVAGYLLEESGVTDATPEAFLHAIESGTDPSPADIATTTDLIKNRQVRALLLNSQTESSVTTTLQKLAGTSGVPVVTVTETLPAGVTDYVKWQGGLVDALAAAVK